MVIPDVNKEFEAYWPDEEKRNRNITFIKELVNTSNKTTVSTSFNLIIHSQASYYVLKL